MATSKMGKMSREGTTILIEPPETADSVVVIMHGLGDTANGFADVAQMFSARMPTTKFILPTAPTQPVTLNRGMRMPSWYDIVSLGGGPSETFEGIEDSAQRIRGILDQEHEKGMPYNRMVLAGFSQGAAMSLFTGLQLPAEKKLAGLLVMSGYLAGYNKFKLTPGLEDTPVLHQHGTSDQVVSFDMGDRTQKRVQELGATDYTLEPYKGMSHSVSPEELGSGLAFLQKVLAPAKDAAKESGAGTKTVDDMSVTELKAAIEQGGLGTKAVGLVEKEDLVKLLKESQATKEL
ncbi:Acyl-protein thioesterase 1 [Hondaea fermentalgiana]|uniref:Acyl-protein thioesterase 1 n=1 Tax=Hondaea fermentalgiana TaxID=2315210 RepID=A0A2R5G400_9STRA|nr:Acyl-protein thioesterase 1 [Hondaea fermentalgiana]|eukprot:GBG25039.1 Acyl-protein thioesterase 1 [Hondaea fermentalgiana]